MAGLAVGIYPFVAATVGAVGEGGAVLAFGGGEYLVKGAVGEAATIACEVVAIGIVGVGFAVGGGYGVGPAVPAP